MKKLLLSTLLILSSSTLSLSQSDTTLSPMHSAVIDLCESLDFSAKMSAIIEQEFDSVFTAIKSKYPEISKRMMNIMEEEAYKLFKEYTSPKGDILIVMVDIFSKYFNHYEIKTLALDIKSARTVNDLNSAAWYKFVSLQDSIQIDISNELSSTKGELISKLKRNVIKRFEDEGLLEDEWDIFEY